MPIAPEIDAIAGAEIDPEFQNAAANPFDVRQIPNAHTRKEQLILLPPQPDRDRQTIGQRAVPGFVQILKSSISYSAVNVTICISPSAIYQYVQRDYNIRLERLPLLSCSREKAG